MHLAQETAEKVLEAYGAERISFVLANTIQKHSYDGRYSRDNKAWAETIQIPENVSRGTDLNADYIVNSHPAVLDGFVNLFRKAGQEMNHEQEMGQNDIWNLSGQETELAYQAEDRFLFIQDTEGGYDYTFYGMDYREIDGGIYEDSDDMTIEEALKLSPDLRSRCNNDPQIKKLLDVAMSIEGMPRHATMHAAGVVITDKPVSDYVPLSKNDDNVVTQFTMTALEELGLLKMDFLGLRNLTVINDAEKQIKHKNPDYNPDMVDENDKKVFEMFSKGYTEVCFNLKAKE